MSMPNLIDTSSRPPADGGVILVVDDDAITRDFLRNLLRRFFIVHTAEDAEQAWGILATEPVDLILLDIMMPTIDGLEMLRDLRSRPDFAALPVILLTALARDEDVVRGLALGANDYIVKPTDVRVILARVRTQIALKRSLDQQATLIHELEDMREKRSELMHIGIHNLKSPLQGLMNIAELMKEPGSELELSENLRNIAGHIQTILHDLRIIVDLPNEVPVHSLKTLELHDLVLQALNQHEATSFRKGIRLEMGQVEGTITVVEAWVMQSLENLLSNALKFSPRGSTVRVWSEARPDRVRIMVADEGPGVPAAERHLLFQQGGRTSVKPTNGEVSTGLGLWIVRHLVQQMHGQADVEFPQGGGAIFWIELPGAPVNATEGAAPNPAAP